MKITENESSVVGSYFSNIDVMYLTSRFNCSVHDFFWSFACCFLNISLIICSCSRAEPNTGLAVFADLLKPCMERNIPACFWIFYVMSFEI